MSRSKAEDMGLVKAVAFCSGAATLILELLWGRELALTFGSSAWALATVLAAFMAGLGLGSGLGSWLSSRTRRPMVVVAWLELGLTFLGPALSLLLLEVPSLMAGVLPQGPPPLLVALRFVAAMVLLLPPTLLMGASFPLLVAAASPSLSRMRRSLGVLYSAGTVGGMVGVLSAGFFLLPRWGLPGSIVAAAAANACAACLAAWWQRRGRKRTWHTSRESPGIEAGEPLSRRLLVLAMGSGLVVLAIETVWHRALFVVLPTTTATLTVLLGIFLGGLALGGRLVAPLLVDGPSLRRWAGLQTVLAGLTMLQLAALMVLPELVRWIRPPSGWGRVLLPPLALGGGLLLPLTVLLGAGWPLLLAAATPRIGDGGRRVGLMGLFNALGAAAGAAVAGFLMLPILGFGRSLLVLAAAHLVLVSLSTRGGGQRSALSALGLLVVLVMGMPRFGRIVLPSLAGTTAGEARILDYRESGAGTVVVLDEARHRARSMCVDNNAVIGTTYDALKVVRMLGVVPVLLHPRPEQVMVIGYGAGVTTAMVAETKSVSEVEVSEIAPGVVEMAGYFSHLNHGSHENPKVRIRAGDGRNHLLASPKLYDIITCDPVHPLLGSAPLYSVDFFRLAEQRLRPGGLMFQYLPLHRMPEREFRRAIATFQSVFPQTWVLFGLGHGVLVGSTGPLELSWNRWKERLASHALAADLEDSVLHRPAQIAALLQLDPDQCRLVGMPPPSSDFRPYLEFLGPEAFSPGVWETNARLLVENYRSPLKQIKGMPRELMPEVQRLIAGKRLLLFSLLRREAGDARGAAEWARKALELAGDDPEVARYVAQLEKEIRGSPRSQAEP